MKCNVMILRVSLINLAKRAMVKLLKVNHVQVMHMAQYLKSNLKPKLPKSFIIQVI